LHRFEFGGAVRHAAGKVGRGRYKSAAIFLRERYYIQTTLNPALRMSPRAVRDFYLHATDEQKQRFERARVGTAGLTSR